MLHQFIFGLFLGWGAAIPIGPMNLEMIRRNLHFGTSSGIALGIGVSSADLTYVALLSLGALAILTHPVTLKIVAALGSLLLVWFAYGALRLKITTLPVNLPSGSWSRRSFLRGAAEGYVLTLISPYTILFWSSVSSQIAVAANYHSSVSFYYAVLGVLLATISWVLVLNSVVHWTRHRLSLRVMRILNMSGGLMLLGFATVGFWKAFS